MLAKRAERRRTARERLLAESMRFSSLIKPSDNWDFSIVHSPPIDDQPDTYAYGLVAGIVRLEDIGLNLSQFPDGARRWLSRTILAMAPYLIRTLSVVGAAAKFLDTGDTA